MSGSRTFRLFVSSTFSDLKAERNALQEHVFPRLKQLCLLNDCRFQDIDLRWGISEEAGLDQRTMRICIQEVARCQAAMLRPNFVVLLGDRYGWRPLPFEIPVAEFGAVRAAALPPELALLDKWYRLDENAVPPVYRLRPRERGAPEEQYPAWRDGVEGPLTVLLSRVNPAYGTSATEHEIDTGVPAMHSDQHVFGFFRAIDGFPATGAAEFRDLLPDGAPDTDAARRLQILKTRLGIRLGRNAQPYSAIWLPPDQWSLPPDQDCSAVVEQLLRSLQSIAAAGPGLQDAWEQLEGLRNDLLGGRSGGYPRHSGPDSSRPAHASPITLDHLPALCGDVFLRLGWIMLREIAGLEATDAIENDRQAHGEFGANRSRNFIGRRAALDAIEAYVSTGGSEPLAIVGESGSGKTALLAHAAEHLARSRPGAQVVVRFVGATPESADGRALLLSISRDVARRYEIPETEVPEDYRTLARQFPERLAVATPARPLAVFIDALDMLSPVDRANRLGWLPRRLPPHVSLIVSTIPDPAHGAIERRLGATRLVQLDTLSLYNGARLLRRWLGEAKRGLTRRQRRVIMEGFSHSRLPLYLKLAFEAAREWHSALEVGPLGARVSDLIEALFARLSEASNHGEEMVEKSLAYLAAARNGLTEDEVVDLLSRDAEVMRAFRVRAPNSPAVNRLPVVVWSRFYHDLQFYLAPQRADGTTVLTFYHQQVKRVAEASFLAGPAGLDRHADLARYYEADSRLSVEGAGRVYNLRKLAEQPYQQTLGHRWDQLSATLGSLDFLQAKVEAGAGHDAIADFERVAKEFPPAPRGDADPHGPSRAILREFDSAFNQEASAFLGHPETTAQQIYNNLFAHTGLEGPAGDILRAFPGPRTGTASWLRRLTRSPRTSIPRALLRTLAVHSAEVTALAVSPDGRWIASGARNGEIRVCQRSDGAEVTSLQLEDGSVAGLAWIGGPGEPLKLVSAGQSGGLTVWDWEGERAEPGAARTATRVRAIAALPDGRLVIGGDDGTVCAWRAGDPRPHRLYNHQDRVLCVAADRTTGHVVSGGADRAVRLWTGGSPKPPLKGHQRPVRAVVLDPEGGIGVSGDEGGVIRIWGVADQRERRVIPAHPHRVTCLGVLPKAAQVLSGSADTTIKTWDAVTGQPLATLRAHTRPVTCLATDPAGGWFVSAGEDETVRIWQAETDRIPPGGSQEHDAGITTLAMLSDGGVASGSEDSTIRIWAADGRHERTLRGHVGPVTCLLAAPGHLLSGSADRTIRLWRRDGTGRVEIWGRATAGLAQSAAVREVIGSGPAVQGAADLRPGHARTVSCLVPAGQDRVVSAGEDGTVRAWGGEAGRPLESYEPVTGALSALLVLDGWIAGGGTPREVVVWPLRGGRIARRLAGHESSVTCLASLGGDRLVSGGLDGTVRVWSAATGAGRVRWAHPSRVNCVAADPATGVLASGSDDGTVLLGPIEEGLPSVLAGHSAPVRVLALRLGVLASGGDDGRINLWSPAAGNLVGTASLGSAITTLLLNDPDRLWAGTRGASVAVLQLHVGSRRP